MQIVKLVKHVNDYFIAWEFIFLDYEILNFVQACLITAGNTFTNYVVQKFILYLNMSSWSRTVFLLKLFLFSSTSQNSLVLVKFLGMENTNAHRFRVFFRINNDFIMELLIITTYSLSDITNMKLILSQERKGSDTNEMNVSINQHKRSINNWDRFQIVSILLRFPHNVWIFPKKLKQKLEFQEKWDENKNFMKNQSKYWSYMKDGCEDENSIKNFARMKI